MEMDKLGVVTTFIHNIVVYNIPLLYGTAGEIMVEKSGSLNLGVEGMMFMGGAMGLGAAFYFEGAGGTSGVLAVILALFFAFLGGAIGALIYSFLTISLRANQNVTGLALTTFGMGVANFFGVFILNGASYSAAPIANKAFSAKILPSRRPFSSCRWWDPCSSGTASSSTWALC